MKAWQFNTLPIPSLRQECINQLQSKLPDGWEHELLTDQNPLYPGVLTENKDLRNVTNKLRIMLLRDYPDSAWFDTDVKVLNFWVPPQDGSVYINRSASVIFANGQKDVFETLLTEYSAIDENKRRPNDLLKLIKTKNVKYIPEGKFMHYSFSNIPSGNWVLFGNDDYSFKKNDAGVVIFNHDRRFPVQR